MNKICIGILELSPGWKSLLDSLGVRYESIRFNQPLLPNYSCLIINNKPASNQQSLIHDYLSNAGSVLFTKGGLVSIFSNLIKSSSFLPKLPSSYHSAVTAYKLGSGILLSWNCEPGLDFADTTYARKRFYFRPVMHPDELVSTIDKNAILVALDRILSELHFLRKLPYIKKWHSPTQQAVFGFRIDSDFGDKNSILKLYQLSKQFQIPFTWFLHVQAHEEWLPVFKNFEGQEVALHGYEHGTSESYEHIFDNIERGFQKLIDADLTPNGFCVPYGIWNAALGDVLLQFDFAYSSEFSIGYDCLPFFPVHKNNLHPTLQVPIHPICTGSLHRKSADELEMFEYFDGILTDKLRARQPVFFYHHPLQSGLTIWQRIFERVKSEDLNPITFIEYARFWQQRNDTIIEAKYDAEKRQLTVDSTNNNLFIQLAFNRDTYRLLPASKTDKPLHSFKEYKWDDPTFPSDEKQQELRKNRLRLIKTSLFDWRNRKSL